ncbi:MAG: hypothetical protein ACTSUB_05145 [Candidatus Thorarchaeota archaeon]
MENEFQEFKGEIKTWLANLGAVGGSGMDVTMRQIYFRDTIYPALCTEFSNLVGDTEDILDFPLAYLHIYSKIPDLMVQSNWQQQMGKPMKEFARKLGAPELSSFVSDSASQQLLHELKLRALLTPTLMDLINLSSQPNPESFRNSGTALDYIATQITPLIDINVEDEPSKDTQTYYKLLAERFKISSDALGIFADGIETGTPIADDWQPAITKRIEEMKTQLRATKHVSVIDRVLLDAGLTNDYSALSAGHSLVSLYQKVTEIPYNKFIASISRLSENTLFKSAESRKIDLSWFSYSMNSEKFSWFLSTLYQTLTSESVLVVADKTEINKWISKFKAVTHVFLYPFYLLQISSILKSGFLLWKKGDEESFYALCDATFNLSPNFYNGDFPSFMTPGFKKMVGSKRELTIKSLVNASESSIPKDWILLPPTVTPNNVAQLYSAAHNLLEEAEFSKQEGRPVQIPSSYKTKGFDAGKVKSLSPEVHKLVYLPMVIEKGRASIMGKHLGLTETIPHGSELGLSTLNFFNEIKS